MKASFVNLPNKTMQMDSSQETFTVLGLETQMFSATKSLDNESNYFNDMIKEENNDQNDEYSLKSSIFEDTNDKIDTSIHKLELKTYKNEQKINQYKQQIQKEVDQLDQKLQGLSQKQQELYSNSINDFISIRDKEIQKLLNDLQSKANQIGPKDEEILLLRQKLRQEQHYILEQDNNKKKQEKRIKQAKDVYNNILNDKQLYIFKIKDQREELRNLKNMLDEKEQKLETIQEQLETERQQSKLKELEYIKKIAFGGKMGKINVIIDDQMHQQEGEDEINFMTEVPTDSKNVEKGIKNDNSMESQRDIFQQMSNTYNSASFKNTQNQLKPIQNQYNQQLSRYDYTKIDKNNQQNPFTKNQKFEQFVNDILEIGLDQQVTKKEIINFVKIIETFYCDKIEQIKFEKRQKSKQNTTSNEDFKKQFQKDQLENILLEAIEQTKININKRKQRQKIENKKVFYVNKRQNGNDQNENQKFEDFENSKRVQYDEFSTKDKEDILEIFLTNPIVLQNVFQQNFAPQKQIQQNINTLDPNSQPLRRSLSFQHQNGDISFDQLQLRQNQTSRIESDSLYETPQNEMNLINPTYQQTERFYIQNQQASDNKEFQQYQDIKKIDNLPNTQRNNVHGTSMKFKASTLSNNYQGSTSVNTKSYASKNTVQNLQNQNRYNRNFQNNAIKQFNSIKLDENPLKEYLERNSFNQENSQVDSLHKLQNKFIQNQYHNTNIDLISGQNLNDQILQNSITQKQNGMNQNNQSTSAPYIQNNYNINFGVSRNDSYLNNPNYQQYSSQSNLPPLNVTKNETRNKLNNSQIQQNNKEYVQRQSSLYQMNSNLQNSVQSNNKSLKILGNGLKKKKDMSIQSILHQTGSFKNLKGAIPKKQFEIVINSINEKQSNNQISDYKQLNEKQRTDSFQETLSIEKEFSQNIQKQKLLFPQLHVGIQKQDQIQNLKSIKILNQNIKLRNQTIQDTIQTQNSSVKLSNKQNQNQVLQPATFLNTLATNSSEQEIKIMQNNMNISNQQNRSSSVLHSYKQSFNPKQDQNEYQVDIYKKDKSNFKAGIIFNQLQNSLSDGKLTTKKVENADIKKLMSTQNLQFQSEGKVNQKDQAYEYGTVQLRNFQIPQLPISHQQNKKITISQTKNLINTQAIHQELNSLSKIAMINQKEQKIQQIINPYTKLKEHNDRLQERKNSIDKKLENIQINQNQPSKQITIALKSKKLVIKGRVPLNKMEIDYKGIQNSYGFFGESPFMNNSAVMGIQIPKSTSQSSIASKEIALDQSNK